VPGAVEGYHGIIRFSNSLIISQIERTRKERQAPVIVSQGTGKEASRFRGVSGAPFFSSFFKSHTGCQISVRGVRYLKLRFRRETG